MSLESKGIGCPDPSTRHDAVAQQGGALVVDLMPDGDPCDFVLLALCGGGPPMSDRDVLYPAHVDDVVDMAQLVYVLRFNGDRKIKTVEERFGGHEECG